MDIITEQKSAERLHLFKLFIKSVISNIEDVPLTSTKQKMLLTGIKHYVNLRLIINRFRAIAEGRELEWNAVAEQEILMLLPKSCIAFLFY